MAIRTRRRRHGTRRLAAFAFWGMLAGGLCWLKLGSLDRNSHPEAVSTMPATNFGVEVRSAGQAPKRPNYMYSVVPGGVYSVAEFRNARDADSVVASHFADFDEAQLRMTRTPAPKRVYTSYRVRDFVYWTRYRVAIPAGETLVTDGIHTALARSGNQLSETPRDPVAESEPTPAALLTSEPQFAAAVITAPRLSSPLLAPEIFSTEAPKVFAPPSAVEAVSPEVTVAPEPERASAGSLGNPGFGGGVPPWGPPAPPPIGPYTPNDLSGPPAPDYAFAAIPAVRESFLPLQDGPEVPLPPSATSADLPVTPSTPRVAVVAPPAYSVTPYPRPDPFVEPPTNTPNTPNTPVNQPQTPTGSGANPSGPPPPPPPPPQDDYDTPEPGAAALTLTGAAVLLLLRGMRRRPSPPGLFK